VPLEPVVLMGNFRAEMWEIEVPVAPHGSTAAMPITPNQTGTSPPKMLALNASIYTLQPLNQATSL